jgi:hypothetical protein
VHLGHTFCVRAVIAAHCDSPTVTDEKETVVSTMNILCCLKGSVVQDVLAVT